MAALVAMIGPVEGGLMELLFRLCRILENFRFSFRVKLGDLLGLAEAVIEHALVVVHKAHFIVELRVEMVLAL